MDIPLRMNEIPVIIYLTVGTYDIFVSTGVAKFWRLYGPPSTIIEEVLDMKQVIDLIWYDEDFMAEC